MIIVNAEAVEATAATLSAAEALEILAPGATALTNEEAASLRQIVAAVARARPRDGATTSGPAAAAAVRPRTGSPPPELPRSSRPPTSRYADALVAAGCASVARLKAMPQEELPKDPRTGGRVLAPVLLLDCEGSSTQVRRRRRRHHQEQRRNPPSRGTSPTSA